jgi:hypothetical protein
MLFGQSIFQSVLDRLDAEEAEALPEAAIASHRIMGLNSSFAADVREGVSAASARPDQAYLDNLDPEAMSLRPKMAATETLLSTPAAASRPVENALPPVMPSHLAQTSPQAVATELSISSKDTLQTLNDKRRAFAKANHPDGIDALFRDKATTRMKIANLLIDEAIRRIEIRSKLSR